MTNIQAMIKFFRRIRQKLLEENRFSNYLLYAVGEIILVVIGILIALQINNWNEQRKDDRLKTAYKNRLIAELETDLVELDRLNNIFSQRKETIQDYFHYLNTASDEMDILEQKLFSLNTAKNTFNSSSYTIEDLITTGNLALFQADIKEAILEFKNVLEKNAYYERNAIDDLLDIEKVYYESTDLAFDLRLTANEHSSVKNWKNDLNSKQYRLIHNNLASTFNLYEAQIGFNSQIRNAAQKLLDLLEVNKQ